MDSLTQGLVRRGLDAYHKGDLAGAGEAFGRVLELNAVEPIALHHLGLVRLAQGREAEAWELLNRAVEAAPRTVEFHLNMARAFRAARDYVQALQHAEEALALGPKEAITLRLMGSLLHDLRRTEEAIEYYRKAIRAAPTMALLHMDLASALMHLGRYEEAEGRLRKAIQIEPGMVGAKVQLGWILVASGRGEEAMSQYRAALKQEPRNPAAHSSMLLSMHYWTDDPAELLARHTEVGKVLMELGGELQIQRRPPRERGGPLRIGYMSRDFRDHSVAYFIEPILAAHDRTKFQVYAYSDVRFPDAVTDRIQALTDVWRPTQNLPHAEVAQLMADDQLDILVDLGGHTSGNRMAVLVAKPAPVQITYLGYPDTTGLATVDYRITDAWADPPGASET